MQSTQAHSIMHRLKVQTADLHRAAEGTAFQGAFMRGTLPREAFVRSLGQLRLVHGALEARLAELASKDALVATAVQADQYQSDNLDSDLAVLGEGERTVALPATRELLDFIEKTGRSTPRALLGVFYVLEGSKNGAKFLAEIARRAYGLTGSHGTRYLDPHGEQQRAIWASFRARMEAATIDEAEQDAIVAAARTTFAAIADIYNQIYSSPSATAIPV